MTGVKAVTAAAAAAATNAPTRTTVLEVLGLRLTPGPGQIVTPDEFLADGGLGVTVMESAAAPPPPGERAGANGRAGRRANEAARPAAAQPPGQPPDQRWVMRITQEPPRAGLNAAAVAESILRSYPGAPVQRHAGAVGGHAATELRGVPGAEGLTRIALVEANGRVYRIVSRDDARGKGPAAPAGAPADGLLEFCEPAGDLEALGLPEDATRRPDAAREAREAPTGRDALPGGADWPREKFLQTPWTANANGNGYASAGPSYFGAGYHQGLNNAYRSNDYYALDFGFENAAEILPNGPGTVLYAGWAGGGWSPYGRVVIVDMGDGYWSLAAHLARIDVAAGDAVTDATVIGLAGGSGNFRDGLWSCHLHNALYKDATLDRSAGGIYGGQSVRPRAVRFFRNGGGAYDSIQAGQTLSW